MKLKSFYGNEIVITDEKNKIARLKDLGFSEVKEKKEVTEEIQTISKGSGKNGNKKNAE